MRRWGLTLSIAVLVLVGLALTNPSPGQLYNHFRPGLHDAARRVAAQPSGTHRAIENAGASVGPLGAAIAGGLVGTDQAEREAAFLAESRAYFDSHLVTVNAGLGSLFIICFQASDGSTIRRTWLGLAHQLNRAEQSAARTLRTDQTIRAWEQRKERVRRAYRKLRGLGVAHRAAVLAVSEQAAFSDLCSVHGWRRSDFSACIGPASLYQPSVDPGAVSGRIRAVPNPRQAKQVSRGGLVKTGRAAS